jgi:hypothetical protein
MQSMLDDALHDVMDTASEVHSPIRPSAAAEPVAPAAVAGWLLNRGVLWVMMRAAEMLQPCCRDTARAVCCLGITQDYVSDSEAEANF